MSENVSEKTREYTFKKVKVLKNSFGVSVAFVPKISTVSFVNKLTGSSLTRKVREKPEYLELTPIEKILAKPLIVRPKKESDYKFRSMSARTKSKIRKKVIAFSRQNKKLSFVTLTFLNKVTDRKAIKALAPSWTTFQSLVVIFNISGLLKNNPMEITVKVYQHFSSKVYHLKGSVVSNVNLVFIFLP